MAAQWFAKNKILNTEHITYRTTYFALIFYSMYSRYYIGSLYRFYIRSTHLTIHMLYPYPVIAEFRLPNLSHNPGSIGQVVEQDN